MPGFELVGIEEQNAVNEIFEDGGILFAHSFDNMRNGRYRVREFEKEFADYLGVKYAQAVASGTAAVKVALRAAGVGAGDEVITQVFTFVATVEAIIDLGAKPVIVNIDETLNLDPVEVEKAITLKTKAIMPVHMLGVPANMEKIYEIAGKHNIKVVDDNCEALGSEWKGNKVGTMSDACAWSFDAGKVIITGEGGMITTNDEETYMLAREYHDHGHELNQSLPRGRDTHRIFGFNYRMSELQAAVGLAQLKKLDFIVETNRRHYKIYEDALKQVKGLKFRQIPSGSVALCDCLIFSFPEVKQANEFVKLINANGLGTKIIPDAVEWHFARYWDHIFTKLGITREELWSITQPSAELLEKSVAIPIMVKSTPEQLEKNSKILVSAAEKII